MKKWFMIAMCSFGCLLLADEEVHSHALLEVPPAPWLTGPLIVPLATVVPYGDFEIQSYVYCTTNTGAYNQDWNSVSAERNFFSLNPQFQLFFGLTPWMDINISAQFYYNTVNGQNSVNFGDFPVALDFQLLDSNYTPYFPGIKLIVREIFPTGPYQQLNPRKLLADQTGAGTYATALDLVFYKTYHLEGIHFLSTTYSIAYTVNSPVHVHGFNTYGGGYGTNGKILPGNNFQAIASFELTLTQNWVLAIDNVYSHTDATQFFKGDAGTRADGQPASIELPSSEQVSFAPAIEYNFSCNCGLIAGCWFTAWGRNSMVFRSGVVNVCYTY